MTNRRLDIQPIQQRIPKRNSPTTLVQLWTARYSAEPPPAYSTLYRLKKKFGEHGTVANRQRDSSGLHRTGVALENALAVWESVTEHPEISTRRRAAMTDISQTSLRGILRTKLGLLPYHI